MARDATRRGHNRFPRERRQYAQVESSGAGGRFLTRRDIVIVNGLPMDNRTRDSIDNPNVYTGIADCSPNFGKGAVKPVESDE